MQHSGGRSLEYGPFSPFYGLLFAPAVFDTSNSQPRLHAMYPTSSASDVQMRLTVMHHAQDATFWRERLGVQRAPALVFLRGPGVAPAVFDTSNSKRLDVGKLAVDNQWQVSLLLTAEVILNTNEVI